MSVTIGAFGTALIGFASVLGATVAVCLGHIDSSTFIAIVGPLAGVGVGAGIHSQGTMTGATVVTNGAALDVHEAKHSAGTGA